MKKMKSGELSKILGVSQQTISNYRKKGMPYQTIDNNGHYLYDLNAILWVIVTKNAWRQRAINFQIRVTYVRNILNIAKQHQNPL